MENNINSLQNELRKAANAGFEFEVVIKNKTKVKGFWGFFQKRILTEEKRLFTIKELTMGIFDRISIESAKMEDVKTDVDDFESYMKVYARKHSKTMGRIIALAVLGSDYFYYENNKIKTDDSSLNDLINCFNTFIKPHDMLNLLQLIDIASNLGDFMNSARLVTAAEKIKIKADGAEPMSQV